MTTAGAFRICPGCSGRGKATETTCRACGRSLHGQPFFVPGRNQSGMALRGQRGLRWLLAAGLIGALAYGVTMARILGAPGVEVREPTTVAEPGPVPPEVQALPFAEGAPATGPVETYHAIIPPDAPSAIQPAPAYRDDPRTIADSGAAPPEQPEASVNLSVRPAGLLKPSGEGGAYTDEDLARIARERAAEALAPPPEDAVPVRSPAASPWPEPIEGPRTW